METPLLVLLLVGLGATAGASKLEVTSGMAEVREPRIYFEMAGEGEPVVLIHGGNLDRRMWDDQFEALAARYRVVRYDVRGFGKSDLPDKPYADFTDLAQVLDYLGIDTAHLVGLSMGGRIAIDFALTYPDRVRSLVLAGPGLSGFRFSPAGTKRFYEQIGAAQRGDWDTAFAAWATDPYFAPAMGLPAIRSRVEQIARDNQKTLLMNWMLQIDLDPPAIGRLPELHGPALVIVGENDVPDIFAIAELLQENVPGIEREDIAGSGHLIPLEKPQEFNRAVLGFLARVTAGKER